MAHIRTIKPEFFRHHDPDDACATRESNAQGDREGEGNGIPSKTDAPDAASPADAWLPRMKLHQRRNRPANRGV